MSKDDGNTEESVLERPLGDGKRKWRLVEQSAELYANAVVEKADPSFNYLFDKARNGDQKAGRMALQQIIGQLSLEFPLGDEVRGYLVEVLNAALAAPTRQVAEAMHIVKPSNRPPSDAKFKKHQEYLEIYLELAAGVPVWHPQHPEHYRHADILHTIKVETDVSDTTVRTWWNNSGFLQVFMHWNYGPPPDIE